MTNPARTSPFLRPLALTAASLLALTPLPALSTPRPLQTASARPAPPLPPGPASDTPAVPPARRPDAELLKGIRVDLQNRLVEFDGEVPIDAHDAKAPHVYLEVIVCTRDTKEHESLVVTSVRPSDVHAALLALGANPGHPGGWRLEGDSFVPIPPQGDLLDITFVFTDPAGNPREDRAESWIVSAESRAPFAPSPTLPASPTPPSATPPPSDEPSTPPAPDATSQPAADALPPSGFVFAGSRFVTRAGPPSDASAPSPAPRREVYDADGAGTLIGLCTFTTETIAWRRVISPDAAREEPEWIADAARVPPRATPVTVRIRLK